MKPFGLGGLLALFLASSAVAEERAIIILDASGSMWGQIDGTPKITIARDVLGEVLTKVPRETALGFMAYGHREKGSCTDIELFIAPAPAAAAEIDGTARGLSPKGKTPLSDAVRQAAEALKYTEQKSTVILITDGLETCNADPCAVARELEAAGVDFTAHVVGFGLSAEEGRQVACLAEETGGQYFQAGNADALAEALTESVAEATAPAPPPQVTVAPDAAPPPTASLDAPESVEIGKTFTVTWEGPGEEQDHVWLFNPAANDGAGKLLRGRRVTMADFDKRQVSLAAPVVPGTYELQYHYGPQRAVIAARAIAVTEAAVSISAPASADIGKTIVVGWVGPGAPRDSIYLSDPAAKQGAGAVIAARRLENGDFAGRKVNIVLPTTPGFYQLQYYSGDATKVLASREIEVLGAEVSVAGPETVEMGRDFDVTWIGPGGTRDSIQLYDPDGNNGNGRIVSSKRLANGDVGKRMVRLVAPVRAGDYQLRYHDGNGAAVLATVPIGVVATEVTIAAPDRVPAGVAFTVDWVGPGGARDSIDIVAGGAADGKAIVSSRLRNGDYDKRKVKVKAPKEAGPYMLRYYSGEFEEVLTARPVIVE